MTFGQGRYRINIPKYYSMALKVFTHPQWFFQSFFPRIPIEIFYTIIAVMLVGSVALNSLIDLIDGRFMFFYYVMHTPVLIGISAIVSTVFFVFFSQLFAQNKLSFHDAWRLTCFFITLSIPLSIQLPLSLIYLSFFIWGVSALATIYLGYLTLKHYLRCSSVVLLIHNALVALFIISWFGAAFTTVRLTKELQAHSFQSKELKGQIPKYNKQVKKYGH